MTPEQVGRDRMAFVARAPVRRLLVRGVNWLGDAVMTTPALLRLREALPEAHISLLSPEKLADLWRHHPAVDAVMVFQPNESLWHLGGQLRRERFDAGLVFPNSPRSALELWLARIPRRIGYATSWRRWWLTDALPTRSDHVPMRRLSPREVRQRITMANHPQAATWPGCPPRAHHLYHYLHLAAVIGANPEPLPPHVRVTPAEIAAASSKFGVIPDRDRSSSWLGLNPGAEYGPAKRWPAEHFSAAAIEITRRSGCRWLVFGGRADVPLADRVSQDIRGAGGGSLRARTGAPENAVLNVAGRTSLRELCALMSCCRAIVTNDTGPMHLAGALGVPLVVPFGSTSAELTGPGLPGAANLRLVRASPPAPCAPCFRRECPIDFRCLRHIEPERVVAAVLELLGDQ